MKKWFDVSNLFTFVLQSTDIDVDVGKVMDTWTHQMGYPVVTVERNGNAFTAKQERFLYNPRGRLTEAYISPYK